MADRKEVDPPEDDTVVGDVSMMGSSTGRSHAHTVYRSPVL